MFSDQNLSIFILDLNGDGQKDYLVIGEGYNVRYLFSFVGDKWQTYDLQGKYYVDDTFKDALKQGSIEIVHPEWKQVKIGNTIFTIHPNPKVSY